LNYNEKTGFGASVGLALGKYGEGTSPYTLGMSYNVNNIGRGSKYEEALRQNANISFNASAQTGAGRLNMSMWSDVKNNQNFGASLGLGVTPGQGTGPIGTGTGTLTWSNQQGFGNSFAYTLNDSISQDILEAYRTVADPVTGFMTGMVDNIANVFYGLGSVVSGMWREVNPFQNIGFHMPNIGMPNIPGLGGFMAESPTAPGAGGPSVGNMWTSLGNLFGFGSGGDNSGDEEYGVGQIEQIKKEIDQYLKTHTRNGERLTPDDMTKIVKMIDPLNFEHSLEVIQFLSENDFGLAFDEKSQLPENPNELKIYTISIGFAGSKGLNYSITKIVDHEGNVVLNKGLYLSHGVSATTGVALAGTYTSNKETIHANDFKPTLSGSVGLGPVALEFLLTPTNQLAITHGFGFDGNYLQNVMQLQNPVKGASVGASLNSLRLDNGFKMLANQVPGMNEHLIRRNYYDLFLDQKKYNLHEKPRRFHNN
jgi:hypothetical protein